MNRSVILGAVAALLTAAAIILGEGPLNTVNLPVILLLLAVGPFALVYLILPAIAYPLLVAKCPVARGRLARVLILSLLPLAASAVYLSLAADYPGNNGRTAGIVVLLLTSLALAILAGAAYLRESRAITLAYHAVLTVWFFAASFPYLGEFP